MAKTFVLDTSVVLFDPMSIYQFGKSTVHIPLVVVEELDKFKRAQNENGRNARHFSRIVDSLRSAGSLSSGVDLENGAKLVISMDKNYGGKNLNIDFGINDNLTLAKALNIRESGEDVIVVSKDINLRVKADALGLTAEDYGAKKGTLDELYSGQRFFEVSESRLDEFETKRFLSLESAELPELTPNEYLILCPKNNPNRRLLGRYCKSKQGVVPLIKSREGMWGIYPKNVEQQFAVDALINNEIKLVSLVGKAGTGKTLMAIAAGMEMAINRGDYIRVLVTRPIWPLGKDLGFLPGDVNDKLAPWMQPIFDNIDYLFGHQKLNRGNESWEHLIDQGLLHVEPLTYIRGRSIPSQFLIVDEAQNLTPHEIKTIITRAGDGTKIVLTGDCEQIDNPYLDSVNNGLAYCIDHLKSEEITSHAILKIGERSQLAEIASKLL